MSNIAKFLIVAAVAIGGVVAFYPNFQGDNVSKIEPAAGTVDQNQELIDVLNSSLERANKALEDANKALAEQNTFDSDDTTSPQ